VLQPQVTAAINTKPHHRHLAAAKRDEDDDEGQAAFEEQQYLSAWGLNFDAVCDRYRLKSSGCMICTVLTLLFPFSATEWNWPKFESLRKLDDCRKFHTALIVLYSVGAEEIDRIVHYETELVLHEVFLLYFFMSFMLF
jgi:hypothetical protein